jgi:hypothetical protein
VKDAATGGAPIINRALAVDEIDTTSISTAAQNAMARGQFDRQKTVALIVS